MRDTPTPTPTFGVVARWLQAVSFNALMRLARAGNVKTAPQHFNDPFVMAPMPSPPGGFGSQRPTPGYLLGGVILDPASPRELRRIDGAIAIGIRTETVREVGPLNRVRANYPGWPLVMAEGCVIIPAFSDAHTQWVNHAIRGRAAGMSRLEFLETEVYAEEARFTDLDYAAQRSTEFFEEAIRLGTLTAFVVSSLQIDPLAIFFDTPRIGRWYAGNVLCDAMAPHGFRMDTTEAMTTLEDCLYRFGARYVISPRSIPACTPELLQFAGSLALDEIYVQTQLGSDPDQVSLVEQMSQRGEMSAELLDQAGLLSPRSLLAHCNYLDDREWRTISALDCIVVHCPASDEAQGAARMPLETVRERHLRWALGSDVGGSPSLSMLYVMQRFLDVHTGYTDVTAGEALYRATCVVPEILGHDPTGRLAPGYSADFVVCYCPEAARETDPERCLRVLLDGSIADLENRPTATIHRGHLVSGGLPELIP